MANRPVLEPTASHPITVEPTGKHVTVRINGEVVQDVNLDEHTQPIERHDGSPAPALKDRPRRGHIGFQELSRGGAHVLIKNAKITEME